MTGPTEQDMQKARDIIWNHEEYCPVCVVEVANALAGVRDAERKRNAAIARKHPRTCGGILDACHEAIAREIEEDRWLAAENPPQTQIMDDEEMWWRAQIVPVENPPPESECAARSHLDELYKLVKHLKLSILTSNHERRIKEALAQPCRSAERAERYAHTLCVSLAQKYPAVAKWKPVDDLLGLLMQIDNMATGLISQRADLEARLKQLQVRNDELVGADALRAAIEPVNKEGK